MLASHGRPGTLMCLCVVGGTEAPKTCAQVPTPGTCDCRLNLGKMPLQMYLRSRDEITLDFEWVRSPMTGDVIRAEGGLGHGHTGEKRREKMKQRLEWSAQAQAAGRGRQGSSSGASSGCRVWPTP